MKSNSDRQYKCFMSGRKHLVNVSSQLIGPLPFLCDSTHCVIALRLQTNDVGVFNKCTELSCIPARPDSVAQPFRDHAFHT